MESTKITPKNILPKKQVQTTKRSTVISEKVIITPTKTSTPTTELTESITASDTNNTSDITDSDESSESEGDTLVSSKSLSTVEQIVEVQKPIQKTIRFSFKSKNYSFLSNFYIVDLNIDGKDYYHVEGYYQSRKFVGFNDRAAEHIRFIADPIIAKKRATTYNITEEKIKQWNEGARDIVMNRAILAKFICNVELTQKLIDTENCILESIDSDEYWGLGDSNRGQNKLGKILMHTRSVISNILS